MELFKSGEIIMCIYKPSLDCIQVKIFIILIFFSISLVFCGCVEQGQYRSPYSNLPEPTKNIIVTTGDLSKPYNILGEIECRLDNVNIINEVNGERDTFNLCRKVAFAKYGNQVDALINMQYTVGATTVVIIPMLYSFTKPYGKGIGKGIAVHFK